MKLNKFWFKPKRYGYGAYPVSWEGWALVAGYLLFFFLAITAFEESVAAVTITILMLTVILIHVSKTKTEGEWKWRWGNS